ncbi:BLUF domain-containing protein [Pedobacter sp. L105]|uniref:BLUF domain-containing protein n=1 Tax=Pedobacter sp. L105 TaxID=1641871 RepID=UPI00131E4126|nr:BLUF domain-containing protein [Pedobacter sp. L105]
MSFYLIYISKATNLLSDQDLVKILKTSRDWNHDHDITGMLLYVQGCFLSLVGGRTAEETEGRFIQILEGAETDVMETFKAIRSDERHYDLMLLRKGTAASRSFESWDMGFRSLDLAEYKTIPGFFELDDSLLEKSDIQQSNFALNFMKSFYEMSKSKL